MKSCYNDETLNVSKEAFERPENLSIEIDCEKYQLDYNNKKGKLDDDSEIDF